MTCKDFFTSVCCVCAHAFSDRFGYQLSGNGRWVSLTLRKPRGKGKNKQLGRKAKQLVQEKGNDDDDNNNDSGEYDEDETSVMDVDDGKVNSSFAGPYNSPYKSALTVSSVKMSRGLAKS